MNIEEKPIEEKRKYYQIYAEFEIKISQKVQPPNIYAQILNVIVPTTEMYIESKQIKIYTANRTEIKFGWKYNISEPRDTLWIQVSSLDLPEAQETFNKIKEQIKTYIETNTPKGEQNE